MSLNTRLLLILSELMRSSRSLKGDDLSRTIGISTRTLRNDIKLLNDSLLEHGATIASTNNGYQLNVLDENSFVDYRNQFEEISLIIKEIPQENDERIRYLIKRFLMANDYLKAEALADELYISKSSLTNLLKEVKERLAAYELALASRPNYGLKISGNELQLRACISEYFFTRCGRLPALKQASFIHSYFSPEETEKLEQIVHKCFSTEKIKVSDRGYESFLIHLSISIKRLQMGMHIEHFTLPIDDICRSNEFQVIQNLTFEIDPYFTVQFSEGEKLYLTIQLIGNRLSSNSLKLVEEQKAVQLVNKMLENINNKMSLDFSKDLELTKNLVFHLCQTITRLLLGLKVRNPLVNDIITHYPLAFEAAMTASAILEEDFNVKINKDEICYIAIHLEAAIERKNGTRVPKRCIIICGSGKSSAVLLKYKLRDYFGNLLEVVETIGYYEWKDYSLPNNIDFIISTISVELIASLPVINVNYILGPDDMSRIQDEFFKESNSLLYRVIKKELIFLQRNLSTKEEVLSFLCEKVMDKELADLSFEKEVWERELFSATAFGNFVAIPHPMKNISKETFLAFCTLPKPIMWGKAPVQLVCLFSVQKDNKEDLEPLYDFLYGVLNDREKVEQLIQADSIADFTRKLSIV